MTDEQAYDAAAQAYRDDPTDDNRAAYEETRDAVVAKRQAERADRTGVALIAEGG